MDKRKHQKELSKVCQELLNGYPITDIIVHATPGAGKSALPIIMADALIPAGLAEAICWIVPRTSLRQQAESNFMDPFFRKLIGHTLSIRAAMNDLYPCRGHSGFVTTYQAVSAGNSNMIADLKRRKYILVLDEFHHLEQDGEWHKAIDDLYRLSKYRLLMTGTLKRGDKKRIAYLNYKTSDSVERLVLHDTDNRRHIFYSRADALDEKAILPIQFHLHDGKAKWIKDGIKQQSEISTANTKLAAAAIYTALNTGFATELLKIGLSHWARYKAMVPTSKAIVIAPDIKTAKQYQGIIRNEIGVDVDIATSEDTKNARQAICAFRSGRRDVLLGVAMFYEGFDCKQISHIICLTNIRSEPWVEQMVARAVRLDPELEYDGQYAYVFAPDDIYFRRIMVNMISEQNLAHKKKTLRAAQQGLLFADNGDVGQYKPPVKPIGSTMYGGRELRIDQSVVGLTPSEKETAIRNQIDRLVKILARMKGVHPKQVNYDVFYRFKKRRKEMIYSELESVKDWLDEKIMTMQKSGRRPARKVTARRVPAYGQ